MSNPIYEKMKPSAPSNSMLSRLLEFKKNISGDPEQIARNLLNSGKISQADFNRCAEQTNKIYQQFKQFL